VRFSDFAGIPNVPDNDPNARPHGLAIRFFMAEHVHTDIIGHSLDGFPVRTVEDFLEFLRAAAASGPGAEKPAPIEKFLAAHPAALEFVQTPKPMPASFATVRYFAVNAYRFTNSQGVRRYGRYRIHPEGDPEYLDAAAEANAMPDALFDEIRARVAKAPVNLRIAVQVAGEDDIVNDSTVHWPKDRLEIDFGMVTLTAVAPNNEAEQRHIIFDPIPRVEGIGPSDDPLLDPRATIYLMSGRRRRAAHPS
jgi:catalase